MKFLVDAQLPRSLGVWLAASGHQAVHTLDLPDGNRTRDTEVVAYADAGDFVVVTKDADFVRSFHLAGKPRRLLLIATGNIGNARLGEIVRRNAAAIVAALADHRFVELGRDSLTIRE